ncbi:MAG: DNA/RNA non-specific endonuclease [Deltaproteobacteria bacterium]|nr:DNA/RNA non-specific endonuclease [Myxococcales bacterium]MDP3221189.1 DNA/RNA non-specific endonuclease [Deltaproteobacteria bacterium]
MKRSERLARLQESLTRIAEEDSGGLESMGSPDGLDLIEVPDTREGADARQGARKLAHNRIEDISDDEMSGLEAIVMPRLRPVVFVRNGVYDPIDGPWTGLNEDPIRARLQPTLASIGRIELVDTPWTYGGTGFVVGPDLMMTNRHVARIFAQGVGDRRIAFRAGEAAVDFKREVDTADDDRGGLMSVRDVVMIHPYWDMALLRVDGLSPAHPPLTLGVDDPDALAGRDVIVVGYPARDDRNDLALQDRIFQRVYNVKRVQPGKVLPRARVTSFGRDVLALAHDSSTLGGNSGSAVVDVATGEVLALHFGGLYLKANYGVPAYELGRDARVVAAGVKFRGALAPTDAWDDAWSLADGSEQRAVTPPPRPPPATPPPTTASPPSMTFTVPIQVTISVGAVSTAGVVVTAPAAPIAAAIAPGVERPLVLPVIRPGLSRRRGYRPDFLGADDLVPLPALTAKGLAVAAKLDDGSTELRYHHFSVVLHKRRRLALFTAANVDWRPEARLVDGRKPTRAELTGLPDNAAEMWATDSRVAEDHQLPDDFYTRDDGAFDKGHLVRREDVCWGRSFDDIQKANGDTFHTTNCSPQVKGFNQSAQGVDNWGDLENMVQKETRAERVMVFSGPVLADDDEFFHGRDQRGPVSIQIPRSFWKIVVAKTDEGLRAYGFALEQDLAKVPLFEEFVVPPAWQRYRRSVSDIEEMLGGWVDLGWFKRHDGVDTDEARRMGRKK